MMLPPQTPAIRRPAGVARAIMAVTPSGCSVFKKIACGAALATCVAACAGGPGPCVACLASIGASSCADCI